MLFFATRTNRWPNSAVFSTCWVPLFCSIRLVLLIGCACFQPSTIAAQNIPIDSLYKLLAAANNHPASGAARIKQLNKLAHAYMSFANDSTLHYASEALTLAKTTGDINGEADALVNLMYYYSGKADYNKTLELSQICLDTYKSVDNKSGIADAYMHMADVYKKMGGEKITEAYILLGLEYSKKACDFAIAINDTNRIVMALNLSGIIFRDWGKKDGKAFFYDSAYTCYMKALALVTKTGGTDNLGRLYNNISQVFSEYKKDPNKALEYLLKAEAFNAARSRYTSLSYNYGNISSVYISLGNKQKALEYAHKTVALAKTLNKHDRLLNAYTQLAAAYEYCGHFDSALYTYKLSTALGDSITNTEKTKQLAEIQTKYESTKKQAAIDILDIENKAKTKNIYWLLGGLLLLGSFAVAMIILYRRVQKQKVLLAEQTSRLELMMKELHHRVKNNLQIVSSLLSLQSYRLSDAEAVAAMNESKQRVQAMSLIHQRLYKTNMLTQVNIKEYITDLTASLMDAYGFATDDFDLHIDINKALMEVEKALPIGLILNELITNAFKYAYANIKRPSLSIMLVEENAQTILTVKDNGKGFDTAQWNSKGGSFGKQLVGSLCKQLRATQSVSTHAGASFSFVIPATAA